MQREDKPGYPERLTRAAAWVKAILQMLIGVYAVGWLAWAFLLSHRVGNCVPAPAGAREQFCYLIPPAQLVFRVIADALAAATVIQLAYTLFTPGPDEALDPVLLALAAALLVQLGTVEQFHWQSGVAVLLYAAALGGLFAVRVFIAPDEDATAPWWWPARPRPVPLPRRPADDGQYAAGSETGSPDPPVRPSPAAATSPREGEVSG